MLTNHIEAFRAACQESSAGWNELGSVFGPLYAYISEDGCCGFNIQLTEAKVHLFITKDDLQSLDFWRLILDRIHSSPLNWEPLQVACWNSEHLVESGDDLGNFSWESVTKLEVSSPLFDINDQLLLREYVEDCFEFAGLVKDVFMFPKGTEEGSELHSIAKRYERSKALRRRAVEIHGSDCLICGMSFILRYGAIGEGFIHVHHIERLADTGKRLVNPVTDLIPVCPNCHSMLHRSTPPMLPDELKALMKDSND